MSDTLGSIRPPPARPKASAVPNPQMHLIHAADAEDRHVAAFWATYDLAPRSRHRWFDAAAAYWGSAASTRDHPERHESMYR